VIGFVSGRSPDTAATIAAAFRKGLNETGYTEGQNVAVEYHYLEGQYDRLPALMADLVGRRVAAIATPASVPAALAAKAATATIPIVFGVADDPVQLGLVASLARPGGNATGINYFATELAAKRLRLLHDLVPKAVRVAVLVNPANVSATGSTIRAVQEAAATIGLQIQILNATTIGEIDAVFAAFPRERPDALFVAPDSFLNSRRVQIVTLAVRDKIPASYDNRDFAAAGGLMSYGTDAAEMFQQVGFAAGSGLDIYARLIAQWLSERLGQSFVIENRLGAGGNVATEAVVNAPPDGYTILMASTAAFTNAWLYDNLSFNFVRDIAPVGSVTKSAFIIVADPSFPPKTIPELIAYAKANPGKVTFGSAGTGTVTHIAGELFNMMAGIDMVHVPYRGEPPALNDLMGGRIQLNVGTLAGSGEFIRTGKLRALAVTTAQRTEMFPDVPAVAEFLPGYEASLWNGIGAPRATPPEVIAKLNAALNEGLADPKIKAQFAALGGATAPLTPAEYGHVIVSETEKWGKVIRAANIKSQ